MFNSQIVRYLPKGGTGTTEPSSCVAPTRKCYAEFSLVTKVLVTSSESVMQDSPW